MVLVLPKTSSIVPLGHGSYTPANRSSFCFSCNYPFLEKNPDYYSLPVMLKRWHENHFWWKNVREVYSNDRIESLEESLFSIPTFFFLFWMLACEDVMSKKQHPSCDQDELAAEEGQAEEWKGPESLMGNLVTKPHLGLLVKQPPWKKMNSLMV